MYKVKLTFCYYGRQICFQFGLLLCRFEAYKRPTIGLAKTKGINPGFLKKTNNSFYKQIRYCVTF